MTAALEDLRAAPIGRTVAATAVAAGTVSALLGWVAQGLSGNRDASWVLGRAAGLTSYLLLVLLVAVGLVLSHPWRTRIPRPSTVTRIRVHGALAAFTLAFTVLHIAVLATDRYAGLGWRGALLPMASSYRPVAVTLGLIGTAAGILAGITAALAGRTPVRIWWPVHKVASAAFALVWAHGLLAGSDSLTLRWLYLASGGVLVLLAITRYTARTPADRRAVLVPERRSGRAPALPR